MVLHRIYTKMGDKGKTFGCGCTMVNKDSLIVEINGEIDALLSSLDIVKAYTNKPFIIGLIEKISRKLWQLAGELTLGIDNKKIVDPITENDVHWTEIQIDRLGEPPTKFIRFSKKPSAFLNESRVRCRKLERLLVKYSREEGHIRPEVQKYINRLSDLLFMMAYVEEKG